jgi:hypothetical protein
VCDSDAVWAGVPPIQLRQDKRKSWNVSRVLLSLARRRLSIWVVCYQVPQADRNGTGKRPTIVPALLPTGVYRASTSRYCWCALTAPLHPYQLGVLYSLFRRYFSVALSSRSLALGITQQVWSFGSPDFPRIRLANSQPPHLLSLNYPLYMAIVRLKMILHQPDPRLLEEVGDLRSEILDFNSIAPTAK